MSNTSWLAIPALAVCVEVTESEALSALIDNQMRVADSSVEAPGLAGTVAGLMLAAIVLCACTGQASEPGGTNQRAPFYYDLPDPYHYREPFQAG